MNIKKQWVKPVMVTEQFSADQYVAICAVSTEYHLYMDFMHKNTISYSPGADGYFQDERHINGVVQAIINWILGWFGRSLEASGEYLGVQTTNNPTLKGTLVPRNGNYPIYGSTIKLNDGAQYEGDDLIGSLKKNANNEYYIQGNMS